MKGRRAVFAVILLAGCGKAAVPVGLAPAYTEVAAAAFAVGGCEAAADIRRKAELSAKVTEIDGRISAHYGEPVLADVRKQANGQFQAMMPLQCAGDEGFRRYREAVDTLSGTVSE